MEKGLYNEENLNELLLPFIDKGFLDLFPDVKADLLHTFIQKLGSFYHIDQTDPTSRPSADMFLDFSKVLDLLIEDAYEKYIPDFFIALSLSPPSNQKQPSHVVSTERRLAAALFVLQLDDVIEKVIHTQSEPLSESVEKSIGVIRNNLVVSFGLPSLGKRSDIREQATNMILTIQPDRFHSEEIQAKAAVDDLQAYLHNNDSYLFGEAELHIAASDQIRIQNRMERYSNPVTT